jgi:Uma2 family endonuclease
MMTLGGTVMSAVAKKPRISAEEYLRLERAAEFKSEFYNGEIIAMAGASRFHNRVKENLAIEIGSQLKKGPCQSFSSETKVNVDQTGNYFYPDILIVCGNAEYQDGNLDVLLNPTVVIEVLSPSTENFDRGMKMLNYQRVPSLREYLVVYQDQPLIQHYAKQADDTWVQTRFEGMSATLKLLEGKAAIPFEDIYNRIEFTEDGPNLI